MTDSHTGSPTHRVQSGPVGVKTEKKIGRLCPDMINGVNGP